MTYANVVFSYGTERFIKKAAEVGMDGLILPDVPFEEKEEFDVVCKQYGLDLISLIAPTSHERIAMIAKEAEGFVYCVSSLGVTGMRSQHHDGYRSYGETGKGTERYSMCGRIRYLHTGAGKENGRSVRRCHCRICDRKTLWRHTAKDCVPKVKVYVKEMKDAIKISSRLKSQHRSQSVIKVLYCQRKGKADFFSALNRGRKNCRKYLLDSQRPNDR